VRGGYAVVEFDAFTQPITVDFMRALADELRDARGLIVDLRNNGGGEAEAMTEIASAFLPAGKSLGRFTDRTGRVTFEPQTRSAMLLAADAITRFPAPVVILTSARTSSAAEIFVAAIKEARRATVIGASTCGCVLAIRRRHTLPDGGELDVSEMDYRTAGGVRLEGAGITPDEKISLDIKDLRASRDRALERAADLLKSKDR
jgi:carboxyl-terminal processing protease